MRVSTLQTFRDNVGGLLDAQEQLSKIQAQIDGNSKILQPSDSPTEAMLIKRNETYSQRLAMYSTNVKAAQEQLGAQENTVSSINDILQRLQEISVSAASANVNEGDRKNMGIEVNELLNQVLQLSNTKNNDGEYMFSGSSAAQPYVATSTGYVYQGNQQVRQLAIGFNQSIAISDPGYELFENIPGGNGTFEASATSSNTGSGVVYPGSVTNRASYVPDTYTITIVTNSSGQKAYQIVGAASGQVVPALPAALPAAAVAFQDGAVMNFNGMQIAITGTPDVGDTFTVAPTNGNSLLSSIKAFRDQLNGTALSSNPTDFQNKMVGFGATLKQAQQIFTDNLASLGARGNTITNSQEMLDDLTLNAKTTNSNLSDVDMIATISQFQQQLTNFQAMQQIFVKINQTVGSLMSMIN